MSLNVLGFHLENCGGPTADKQYRVYAAGDYLITGYGPRGGTPRLGVRTCHPGQRGADPAALSAVEERRGRGYRAVTNLRFTVDGCPQKLSLAELDAGFDEAWACRSQPDIDELQQAILAGPQPQKTLTALPLWQSPRGSGGHQHGRPWGPALALALADAAQHYDPGTRVTYAVVDQPVGAWVARHYPSALTADVATDVDGSALVALVPPMLDTKMYRTLADAVRFAAAALA